MRALVLGGTRFLGKALVEELVKAKFEVSVLNRGNHPVPRGEVEVLRADRHDAKQMAQVLNGRYWDVVYDMICVTPADALADVELFKDKTHKLIYISSSFVYAYGQNLHEEQFNAQTHPIPDASLDKLGATETRRVIEAIFAQRAPFKTLAVRMPFIFGQGDPTQKLKKLIKQILLKEPIHLPNAQAKISLIVVEDAAKALLRMGLYPQDGAVNCAAPLPLPLMSLVKMVEEATYCTVRFTEEAKTETLTSFSVKSDWFLDTARLKTFDVSVRNFGGWLDELVKAVAMEVHKDRS